ncbi:ligand-binding protein SH3 [Affinibrenneria salicis]|uniref:Ligand-binding protein SH3 n=2 Tax=Affinibrenneria salicis TaxID=2590031 RepID=A0A5J5FRG3_9GAMM|nr:ligand-binding protein SH3 [Affinibrenneria salicis]
MPKAAHAVQEGDGTLQYVVVKSHRSEYPEPVIPNKGEPVSIGEKYQGPEGWEGWYFCTAPGQASGWGPEQVIERFDDATGRAREDYSARELDVDEGDILTAATTLNGWVWCSRPCRSEAGWVPLANLSPLRE